jgi:hypothetical protein
MKQRYYFQATLTVVMLISLTAACHGAIVHLSVGLPNGWTGASGIWEVYAQLSPGDNAGLASFALDVVGTSGISITSSQVRAPGALSSVDPLVVSGFSYFRSDGDKGIGIFAAQPVITTGTNQVLQGIGLSAGSADFTSTGGQSISWGFPVLIAAGTYANNGLGGEILARVHPGASFQLLSKVVGDDWVGPGHVFNASDVIPGATVTPLPTPDFPEPQGIALLIGAVGFGVVRREMR